MVAFSAALQGSLVNPPSPRCISRRLSALALARAGLTVFKDAVGNGPLTQRLDMDVHSDCCSDN